MFQFGFHQHQHRVPAADDERDIRLELGEIGTPGAAPASFVRSSAANPRRIQMRLVMMDADERFAQGKGDGLRGFEADEQRRRQSRPLRGGNGIELRRR